MIIIVTTLYNAEKFVEQCLGSIMGQSLSNFKCYITDDISTDNSVSIAKNFIQGDDRFILIENKTKLYQPGNYDQVIRNNPDIDDNDVIVEIDGDDWLPNSKVLQRVSDLYEDNNVWIYRNAFKNMESFFVESDR
jgi:glycosyltransferase involved in cell wall biosynthesis